MGYYEARNGNINEFGKLLIGVEQCNFIIFDVRVVLGQGKMG